MSHGISFSKAQFWTNIYRIDFEQMHSGDKVEIADSTKLLRNLKNAKGDKNVQTNYQVCTIDTPSLIRHNKT